MKENDDRHNFFMFFMTFCFLSFGCSLFAQDAKYNYLKFSNTAATHHFFKYDKNEKIIVSGHRGGREKGYPENSMEGFQNVLKQMPAIFEIDPRLTKDSVIVLMHDATLDRTTTATGKLSDYTWAELKDVRLKDSEGNVTPYHIPTLEDVLKWSIGKTILNLDKKDVPMSMIVELIKKCKVEDCVMLTVHTGAQARYYYDRFPNAMLSVFSRNMNEYEDLSISGVPAENMIAYVGETINDSNSKIVKKLREKGIRCMVSYAPSIDKLKDKEQRTLEYIKALKEKPDIIESDIPTEVYHCLNSGV